VSEQFWFGGTICTIGAEYDSRVHGRGGRTEGRASRLSEGVDDDFRDYRWAYVGCEMKRYRRNGKCKLNGFSSPHNRVFKTRESMGIVSLQYRYLGRILGISHASHDLT
jgi:hypothetical protein